MGEIPCFNHRYHTLAFSAVCTKQREHTVVGQHSIHTHTHLYRTSSQYFDLMVAISEKTVVPSSTTGYNNNTNGGKTVSNKLHGGTAREKP